MVTVQTVRNRYERPSSRYPLDAWHRITYNRIRDQIDRALHGLNLSSTGIAVNVGSGGMTYDIPHRRHIHIDLAATPLRRVKMGASALATLLPFRAEVTDLVICVGQVMNYVDPTELVTEIARICRLNAIVLLEFETNESFEFSHAKRKRPRDLIATFHNGSTERIAIYRRDHVEQIFAAQYLEVVHRSSFHILSSLACRITDDPGVAAPWAAADRLLGRLPYFRSRGANAFYVLRKR